MGFWMFLWKAVLVLGLGVFAGMAVWVTVAGWRDIKSLFAAIERSHDQDGE